MKTRRHFKHGRRYYLNGTVTLYSALRDRAEERHVDGLYNIFVYPARILFTPIDEADQRFCFLIHNGDHFVGTAKIVPKPKAFMLPHVEAPVEVNSDGSVSVGCNYLSGKDAERVARAILKARDWDVS